MRINFHLKEIQTHSTKILFVELHRHSTNGKKGKLDYDKEKHKEMILDAAETVLGYWFR
jgi:hypothetical protein